MKGLPIETDELLLRELELGDAPGMFTMDSDPIVHTYLGNHPIETLEQTEADIKMVRQQYLDHGMGRWAIIHKATGDFVGWTGLKYEQQFRPFPYYDLGYRLNPKYWGQGIATTTSFISLKYGFNTLGLSEIHAATDVAHAASNRVINKCGFVLIDTFEYEGVPVNWYRITSAQWAALEADTDRL